MATKFYLGEQETQYGSGVYAGYNCAAASGAMLTDYGTLGIRKPSARWFRQLTGDTSGGLNPGQVAAVLEQNFDLKVRLYDHQDNLKWNTLTGFLERGWFAVVGGDYDVIPDELRGPTDYDGGHSVMYHQRFKENQRVGDPLLDEWEKWPNDLAYEYVRKWDKQTTGGIHAVVLVPREAVLRKGILEAEVRSKPTRGAAVIATMRKGDRLVTGGIVNGEEIAGIDQWRRVWVPSASRIGYVHWIATWQD